MAKEEKKGVEVKETEVQAEVTSTPISEVEPVKVQDVMNVLPAVPGYVPKEYKPAVQGPITKETKLQGIKGKYTIKKINKVYVEKMFKDQKDAKMLFSKTEDICTVPLIREDLFHTGLDKETQAEFEVALNLKGGDLSPYNKSFWTTFSFKIKNDGGTRLDCDNNIKDKLIYCIIKAETETLMSKFALSLAQAEGNPMALYILESEEKEANDKNKLFKAEQAANKVYSTLTLEEMMDFLTVYEAGKYRLTNSNKPDFIENTVYDLLKKDPLKFVNTLEDPNYKEYLFINNCVRGGVINKSGTKYFTKEGDLIGSTILDTVMNIKSPEYNHIKVDLIAKLEAKK